MENSQEMFMEIKRELTAKWQCERENARNAALLSNKIFSADQDAKMKAGLLDEGKLADYYKILSQHDLSIQTASNPGLDAALKW